MTEDGTEHVPIESMMGVGESRFSIAFRESGMPKLMIDQDGLISEVNDALCKLVGYSADELIGKHWSRFGQAVETEHTASRGADLRSGLLISDIVEARLEHKNGQEVWCLGNATSIRDVEGGPRQFLLELQDISTRKQFESALRLSEEKYRKLFQSSPDLLIVSASDSTILEVNDSMERVSGYKPEEVLGRTTDELNLWVDKSDRARYRALLREQGAVYGFETKFRKKSGEIIDALEFGSSIPFDSGTLFLTVIQDITDSKRMEESLREREKEFRDLTESSPFGIIIHQDGIIKYVNPSTVRILRYGNRDEAIGREVLDLLHPDSRQQVVERIERLAAESHALPTFQERLLRKDGEICHAEVTAMAGAFMGEQAAFVFFVDVTDRIEAQARDREHDQQLYRASRLATIGTLMAEIGHEINNPNNYIRLNSQNLIALWTDFLPVLDSMAGERPDLKVRGIPYQTVRGMVGDLLQGVVEGSRRIERLLVDLRDFVRGDEGTLDQVVDLNDVIKSALAIIDDLVRKSTGHFSFVGAPDLSHVQGNFYQLEQVVINLVNNACQALDSSEKAIYVETRNETKGRVALLVRDEGVGIPAGSLTHLMDPFFTTKRERGGSGLGLVVTSRIVRNHGGTIDYASEVGTGTTVTIMLPAAKGNA